MDPKNAEYLKIHVEYKNLVDFMLGSFMEELQISPAKFEMACLEGQQQQQQMASDGGPTNPRAFHQRLFQQIWAANDIRIFIRMMTQRNVELQLQALDLIERSRSMSGSSAGGDGEEKVGAVAPDLIEFNDQGGDESLIEPNAEEFLNAEDGNQGLMEEAGEAGKGATSTAAVAEEQKMSDQFERLNLFFEKEKVDEDEVKERQEYLRAQRDKLLEIKKRTRARQLNESLETKGRMNVNRPSSAQAAQKIMSGHKLESLEPQESSLILRRVLAKRLREEVVDAKKQWEVGN